jgi:hypothetical protein
MIFLFPKREIVLDCFIAEEAIAKRAPIEKSMKYIPDWWKELPKEYYIGNNFFPSPTMKHCAGMVDYYRNSVTIPLWSDLALRGFAGGGCDWQFADGNSRIESHPVEQRANFLSNGNYTHVKLLNPWQLRTDESIKWVWSQPTYNFVDPEHFFVLPGSLDFSKQHQAHINLMLNVTVEKQLLIKLGQPMVHITPMSDRKVKVVRHVIPKAEYEHMFILRPSKFINSYNVANKLASKFSTCPFKKG